MQAISTSRSEWITLFTGLQPSTFGERLPKVPHRSILEAFASTKRQHICLFSRMSDSNLSSRTEIEMPEF
jgi:hypothetical protein